MDALLIAEHDHNNLLPSTMAAINAAAQLTTNITLLIISNNSQLVTLNNMLNQTAKLENIKKILHIHYTNIGEISAAKISSVILSLHESYSYQYIVAANTNFGKNFMPRVAACLDVEQLSEVTKIITADTFERYIYAGNAIQTVQLLSATKCLTVRTANFSSEAHYTYATTASIHNITENLPKNILTAGPQIAFIKYLNEQHQCNLTKQHNLSNANIVVAGGIALQSAENFQLIDSLAKQLNAAVGASKSAVDAGLVPSSYQIGQTGKSIAPKLYIAIGISGALQHISGIKESKVIVAINSDENAPIMKLSNYAIIGDLFKIVPELIQEFATYQSHKEPTPLCTT